MTDSVDVGFYNPHDGIKGRDGGPYLDHVERQRAEVNRALVEKREPADLDGALPATAGTPLVVVRQLVDNSYLSNPSMSANPGLERFLEDKDLDADGFNSPISTLPVDTSDGTETESDEAPVAPVSSAPATPVSDPAPSAFPVVNPPTTTGGV